MFALRDFTNKCAVLALWLLVASTTVVPMMSNAQSAGADVYIVDSRKKDPGYVYRLNTKSGNLDAVFWLPLGTIHSVAFRDKALYFVDGSSRYFIEDAGQRIYRSKDHCTTELIYTHSTYIREIQFDSGGNLYFSEATGATEAGTIFELNYDSASGKYLATAKYAVPLGDVDGYWAGTFAFDPDDKLFVSSGNRVPAYIYRKDASGFTRVYRANNAIMGFSFVAEDTLIYADYGQELRQLVNFTTDTVFGRNSDIEWMGDVAFETGLNFTQLPDRDADGDGDACDCDDNYMGPNEDGADCGGTCGGTCSTCAPVLAGADPANSIDLVFMADKDDFSGTSAADFRGHVRQIVNEVFLTEPTFASAACLFNFYVFDSPADYEASPTPGVLCQWTMPSDIAAKGNCPVPEYKIVVHTSEPFSCQQGDQFSLDYSTDPSGSISNWTKQATLHEFGHAKFNLSDEYCDITNCDGSYWQSTTGQANVFSSETACTDAKTGSSHPGNCDDFCPDEICMDNPDHRALSHWFTTAATAQSDCENWANAQGQPNVLASECRTVGIDTDNDGVNDANTVCAPNWQNDRASGDIIKACTGGNKGWWKADDDTCVMVSGTVFEPDCAKRVTEILSKVGTCLQVQPSAGSPGPFDSAEDRQIKTLVLDLSVEDGAFGVEDARLIYNFPPTLYLDEAAYSVELLDAEGETLFNMALHDPREERIYSREHTGARIEFADVQRFTLYLPFESRMRKAVMIDSSRNEAVLEVDIAPVIAAFCEEHNDDPACSPN